MTIDELRRAVRSLPGVASADVMPQFGAPPVVRIWTDGSLPDAEVQHAVELLVARGSFNDSGLLQPDGVEDIPGGDGFSAVEAARRRSGLGRSLDDTIPSAFAETAPSISPIRSLLKRPLAADSSDWQSRRRPMASMFEPSMTSGEKPKQLWDRATKD